MNEKSSQNISHQPDKGISLPYLPFEDHNFINPDSKIAF